MLQYKGKEVINMRLSKSASKNSTSLYMIKSTYENGVHSSKIVEALGTVEELEKKLDGQDPIEWAKEYIKQKTKEEKKGKKETIAKFSNSKRIPKGKQTSFNGGYLFLQSIYHELKLDKICNKISEKYKFEYDLNAILSRLLYTRIIYPSSKYSSYESSKKFIEPPGFDLHHIYRALDVLAKEDDFIQSTLYQNSLDVIDRNSKVLYYDCTDFMFEIYEEDELRKYVKGKNGRVKPHVQMGLFMDGNGIPLACALTPGSTNEQITLKPLEKKLIKDFGISKLVVCTDAGLASATNRKFNNTNSRSFITTQPIKKLKKFLKEWSLDPGGWSLPGSDKIYDLTEVDFKKYGDKTFFKERWINEDGLEQRLIVSFSFKYLKHQRKVRDGQIERAEKLIASGKAKPGKSNNKDHRRLIEQVDTETGVIDEKFDYRLNEELIKQEEMFDGFYAVCTNLEDDIEKIIEINHRRWEIEESFRIMKSEFKSAPAYLSVGERIIAHFSTCFMSLMIFRILEKKLNEKFTAPEIIDTIRELDFYKLKGEGYVPTYERSDLTDALHDSFGFKTDTEIVDLSQMKKNIRKTKKA